VFNIFTKNDERPEVYLQLAYKWQIYIYDWPIGSKFITSNIEVMPSVTCMCLSDYGKVWNSHMFFSLSLW